jgi:hypothetical protein
MKKEISMLSILFLMMLFNKQKRLKAKLKMILPAN